MPSFELLYDEEEDVLEITFESFNEHFARALPLNDAIVLHTDTAFQTVWGLSFYGYKQLLAVSDTHLTELESLAENDRNRIFTLLDQAPASFFLQVRDTEHLFALVKSPKLDDLLR